MHRGFCFLPEETIRKRGKLWIYNNIATIAQTLQQTLIAECLANSIAEGITEYVAEKVVGW